MSKMLVERVFIKFGGGGESIHKIFGGGGWGGGESIHKIFGGRRYLFRKTT